MIMKNYETYGKEDKQSNKMLKFNRLQAVWKNSNAKVWAM